MRSGTISSTTNFFRSVYLVLIGFTFSFHHYAKAIEHGKVVSPHSEILKLFYANQVCTGTLVGPRVVLSGAHCEGPNHFYFDGTYYDVNLVPAKAGIDWETKEKSFRQTGKYPADFMDLSLGILNKDLPGPYSIISSEPNNLGDKVFLYGYGARRYHAFGAPPSPDLIQGINRISQLEDLYFVFNDRNLFHRRSRIIGGDSGGPTYNRAGYQVGVHSGSSRSFGGFDVRLDSKEAQEFLKTFALENKVNICGINLKCENH